MVIPRGSPVDHVTIRELPTSERPRERLRQAGPAALTTVELLAILLRTGTAGENVVSLASRLLAQNRGLAGLARASWAELCACNGVGEAKAAQIKAALELGRRLQSLHPEERPLVSTPRDAALLVQAEMEALDQEELRVLLLSTKKQVAGSQTIYRGNVNAAVVRAAEVFRPAVRENCPCIIVLHNHPSGDPAPSPEDTLVTAKLLEAGRLLDIELIDHIILGKGRFVSLREQHVGFP
jgi:DNA repair protein RadC